MGRFYIAVVLGMLSSDSSRPPQTARDGEEREQPVRSLQVHDRWVHAIAFSPDGKRLFSGGSGRIPVRPSRDVSPPEDKHSSSDEEGLLVRVWDVRSGELLASLPFNDAKPAWWTGAQNVAC